MMANHMKSHSEKKAQNKLGDGLYNEKTSQNIWRSKDT